MMSWAERNTQYFCFLVGLLCAIPFVFLTPPFQVPDEPQHFFRAYQISEGQFHAAVENHAAGGVLPSSLIELSSKFLGSRAIHADRALVKQSWQDFSAGFNFPLDPEKREFIDFSGAASYSPLVYFPQSTAILIGRLAGARPLTLVYMGRLANAMVAILFISFAVHFSPLSKPGFMASALLPMSLYLVASLSPDAFVISSVFLYTSIAFKAYVAKMWTTFDVIVAMLCAVVFCSVKAVYAPLLFIAFPAIIGSRDKKMQVAVQCLLVILPICITAIWLHAVSDLIVPVRHGTNVAAQLHHVITNPAWFAKAMVYGFMKNDYYFFTLIGMLGWLNLKLSIAGYVIPLIAFLISIFSDEKIKSSPLNVAPVWWLALAGAGMTLVMLALYLYWTPVGAYVVEGVQGRYFIPLLPLVAAGLAQMAPRVRFSVGQALVWVGLLGLAESLLTYGTLLHAYWGF